MSSSVKKIDFSLRDEVSLLLRTLKDDSPLAKSMWQVVKDTRDGLMEANVFTDDWPHFATVVSQEFVPRLSEISDIRIYTKDKHKVIQTLNRARMLDKPGNRQFIFHNIHDLHLSYTALTDEGDTTGLVQHLSEALQQHSSVQKNGLSLVVKSLPVLNVQDSYEQLTTVDPAPGYVVKNLLPEHMRLVAENWNLKDWFTDYLPLEAKITYFIDLSVYYEAMGVFPAGDPAAQPVAWVFRKPGGYNGNGFTIKDERGKSHGRCLIRNIIKSVWSTGDVILHETKLPLGPLVCIGDSHVIMLVKDTPLIPPSTAKL